MRRGIRRSGSRRPADTRGKTIPISLVHRQPDMVYPEGPIRRRHIGPLLGNSCAPPRGSARCGSTPACLETSLVGRMKSYKTRSIALGRCMVLLSGGWRVDVRTAANVAPRAGEGQRNWRKLNVSLAWLFALTEVLIRVDCEVVCEPATALITQRSLVQILPPLQRQRSSSEAASGVIQGGAPLMLLRGTCQQDVSRPRLH
jgi:hypothetical protein